jgi:hypothetical protein
MSKGLSLTSQKRETFLSAKRAEKLNEMSINYCTFLKENCDIELREKGKYSLFNYLLRCCHCDIMKSLTICAAAVMKEKLRMKFYAFSRFFEEESHGKLGIKFHEPEL